MTTLKSTLLIAALATPTWAGSDDFVAILQEPLGAAQAERIEAEGFEIVRRYDRLRGVVLSGPAERVPALEALLNPVAITLDREIISSSNGNGNGNGNGGGLDGLGDGMSDGMTEGLDAPVIPHSNSFGLSGAGVTIAVLDSGIWDEHPDLDGRIAHAVNFVIDTASNNNGGSPHSWDIWGHGTHVAGILAGTGGASGADVQGVAPGAELVDVRVLERDGSGVLSDVLAGIDWVLANRAQYGIRVMNVSLGHRVVEPAADDPLVLAVEQAWDEGIVVVVSAGNHGRDGSFTITSPGNARKVITVGSLSAFDPGAADDAVSTFSSRGPTSFDHVVKPDLLAEGNRILSTINKSSDLDKMFPEARSHCSGGTDCHYLELSGTSMAAPRVAGTVALMLEQDPGLDPDDVKARLMRSARAIPAHPLAAGAGVLDIDAAIADDAEVAGLALSPKLYRNDTMGVVTVEDTCALWGDPAFGLAVLWAGSDLGTTARAHTDSALWSTQSLWSATSLWADTVLAADPVAWSDSSLWSDAILWADPKLWSETVRWSDEVLWSEVVLWSDAVIWSDLKNTRSVGAARGDIERRMGPHIKVRRHRTSGGGPSGQWYGLGMNK